MECSVQCSTVAFPCEEDLGAPSTIGLEFPPNLPRNSGAVLLLFAHPSPTLDSYEQARTAAGTERVWRLMSQHCQKPFCCKTAAADEARVVPVVYAAVLLQQLGHIAAEVAGTLLAAHEGCFVWTRYR